MYKGIFVTATDTGAGKTYIACSIARQIAKLCAAGVVKPFSSGGVEDAKKLIKAGGSVQSLKEAAPVVLKYPLAPMVSAQIEKKKLNIEKTARACRDIIRKNDFTVVEGIGGVMVPLAKGAYVFNFIRKLGLPVLVVAKPSLGTINHTLLTVDKLKKEKIKIAGIILSGRRKNAVAERTNPRAIRALTNLPVAEVFYGREVNLEKHAWITGREKS